MKRLTEQEFDTLKDRRAYKYDAWLRSLDLEAGPVSLTRDQLPESIQTEIQVVPYLTKAVKRMFGDSARLSEIALSDGTIALRLVKPRP